MFLFGAVILAAFLLRGLGGLPAFGRNHSLYGAILNRIAVPQRHSTDVVTAVNFDYRGIDTVGEEFILFVSVAGVALLLRAERDEVEREAPRRVVDIEREARTSEAVQALCLALVPPIVLFGLYVVTHGQVTPGGGFQGGVVLATAPLLIYLGGEYRTLRALSPAALVDLLGALGAGGFVVIGLAGLIAGATGLIAGAAFLQNVVPLGPVGTVISAGTIPLISFAVGLEVGAGFLLMLSEFLTQTLRIRERSKE
jgi:multicomponent Na+:H+ antiporter subunit B